MKRLVIVILSLLLFTCDKDVSTNYVILSGTIQNTKSKQLTIDNVDFKTELAINEDGTLAIRFISQKMDFTP